MKTVNREFHEIAKRELMKTVNREFHENRQS